MFNKNPFTNIINSFKITKKAFIKKNKIHKYVNIYEKPLFTYFNPALSPYTRMALRYRHPQYMPIVKNNELTLEQKKEQLRARFKLKRAKLNTKTEDKRLFKDRQKKESRKKKKKYILIFLKRLKNYKI